MQTELQFLRSLLGDWIANADLATLRRLARLKGALAVEVESALPAGWLSIEAVAAATGKNLGHLRRIAASRYAPAGQAHLARSASTGQVCWFFAPECLQTL